MASAALQTSAAREHALLGEYPQAIICFDAAVLQLTRHAQTLLLTFKRDLVMFRQYEVQCACRRAQACAGTHSAAHDKWLRCLKALQGERRVTWELERQKNSFLQPAVPAHADCRAPLLAKQLTPAPAALLEPHTTARPSPGFTVHVVRLLARNGKSRCLVVASSLGILLCCAAS